ncbi:hypothetical protein [Nannocystis pusilla]|uniref:hypothetical protein n=1 Tax=Nannocystis pusilla TaxID=889268 RepID=UPI003B839BC1
MSRGSIGITRTSKSACTVRKKSLIIFAFCQYARMWIGSRLSALLARIASNEPRWAPSSSAPLPCCCSARRCSMPVCVMRNRDVSPRTRNTRSRAQRANV